MTDAGKLGAARRFVLKVNRLRPGDAPEALDEFELQFDSLAAAQAEADKLKGVGCAVSILPIEPS